LRWLLALALAGCGAPPIASDWERQQGPKLAEDAASALPAFPEPRNLVGFHLLAPSEMRYFIDASSLSVREGVVRYVMVARSPEGAQNVSFEALRCPGEYRLLALGRADGGWSAQPGVWREIRRGMDRSVQYALARNYFCPHRIPVHTAREALEALRAGGHSLLKQN
jgi:CNP1-like family